MLLASETLQHQGSKLAKSSNEYLWNELTWLPGMIPWHD